MAKKGLAVAEKVDVPMTFGMALDNYGLTTKQYGFVIHYIENGGNATQAALSGGYNCKTIETARSVASELLTTPNVRKAIDELVTKQFATPEFVKSRFLSMALHGEKETTRIAATDRLAKIHGMYTTKTEQHTTQTVKIMLPSSLKREIIDAEFTE